MSSRPRADDSEGDAVLRLSGDVDFFTEDGFRAEAEQLLAPEDLQRFIVDMGAVTMIDSSGLSLLVDLLRLCREQGLPMIVRDVPDNVVRLLEMTGLNDVIPAETSRSDEPLAP